MTDISVITNCHNEGRLMQPTIKSVYVCLEEAKQNNLSVEWLIVRDNPNEATIEYTDTHCAQSAKIIDVNFQDLGLSRNQGVSVAEGRYIAFIDGDDLWTCNWLTKAYEFAQTLPNSRSILHPEYTIFFEGKLHTWQLRDSQFSDNYLEQLLVNNCWPVSSFGLKEVYAEYPYASIDLENGLGYEDWHWNCETTAAGISHKIVPDTLHCFRVKTWQESLCFTSADKQCVIKPSQLFALAYQKNKLLLSATHG